MFHWNSTVCLWFEPPSLLSFVLPSPVQQSWGWRRRGDVRRHTTSRGESSSHVIYTSPKTSSRRSRSADKYVKVAHVVLLCSASPPSPEQDIKYTQGNLLVNHTVAVVCVCVGGGGAWPSED